MSYQENIQRYYGNEIRLEDWHDAFKPGEKYIATVKRVSEQGVYVKMPGDIGGGQISLSCWGSGKTREQALSRIAPGDIREVVVKSYDANTKSLQLVLPGSVAKFHDCAWFAKHCTKKTASCEKKVEASSGIVKRSASSKRRKEPYRPLDRGTTFLFDTANLHEVLCMERPVDRLNKIAGELVKRGYSCRFVWERKSVNYWLSRQDPEGARSIEEFVSLRKDVTLVDCEADAVLLQLARVISKSVIITHDHFKDYRYEYPELVGSDRHRSLAVIEENGHAYLSIYGLKDVIDLSGCGREEARENVGDTERDDCAIEVDEEVLRRRAERPEVTPSRRGLLGVADSCIENGKVRRGIALFERLARKSPKIYRDIAQVFGDGKAIPADAYAVTHYERLADRGEKALRERHRRNCRLKAERRRVDGIGHWSHAA